jgi:hypothetical protein
MLAREVSTVAGPIQNLSEFNQCRHINARRTNRHLRARDRVEHPAEDEQKHAVWIPHVHELAVCSSVYAVDHNLASITRMPRVMDLRLLPDMGRMNGQSN